MYSFDPYKLYLRLIPWFLRRAILSDWVKVLSVALGFVQNLLLVFVTQTTYDLLFNAQIIYLEHVLNDAFDDINRLIYIENQFLPALYLYNIVEAQPPEYLRNLAEGGDIIYLYNGLEYFEGNAYIVHLPAALSGQTDAIIALIELYNLAGMAYTLVFDL